ncbi:hypothetical protein P9869_05920 [Streptomyces ossamyceticus]|nr:hypothetical protein [Streptomyces ossamyceticus]
MVWETIAKTVHRFSKHWFQNSKVEGLDRGSCLREFDGNLVELP